jgi:tetratricopeptide (TPR) repeat protein
MVLSLVLPSTAAEVDEVQSQAELPKGLRSFLQARLLEASGRFNEAVDKYAEALRERPESQEIRVAYATLMLKYGLPESAFGLLEGQEDLDWYGLRARALALSQISTQKDEVLTSAEQALRKALDIRHDDPSLQMALAQVAHRLGRIHEAEEIVAELRAKRGGSAQLVAFHAGILHELGRLDEAIELYRECADSISRGVVCRENLTELLINSGRLGEAGEMMLQSLDESDLDQMLRAAALLSEGGRTEQALRVVRRALASSPGSVRALSLEAMLLSGLGRYNEAATRLRDLLRRDSDNLELLLQLAWAEAGRGQADQARDLIERAWRQVEDDTGSMEAARTCLVAARIELAGGRALVAREWLDRISQPDLVGAELVRLLAATYRQHEQWQEGMAAMLRLQPSISGHARSQATAAEAEFRLRMGGRKGYQRLRPLLQSKSEAEVLLGLGVLQALERWQDVVQEASAAATRLPDVRAIRFTWAAAHERLGEHDEASELFQQLLAEDSRDVASANYLGYMWADQGINLEEAFELIARAVEAEPENSAYIDSLGWVHFRLGNLEEAELWLRRATTLGGEGDGTVLAHLGEVLLKLGKMDEARSLLQQALDYGCEHPEHIRELIESMGD